MGKMWLCPHCQAPLTPEQSSGGMAHLCTHCHALGFTQSTFEALIGEAQIQALERAPRFSAKGLPCFVCAQGTRGIAVLAGPDRPENLGVFPEWRHWYDYHLKVQPLLLRCSDCEAWWMNSRMFAQLTIDWERRDAEALESRWQDEDERDNPEGASILPVPTVENAPEAPGIPMASYVIAIVVLVTTRLAFVKPQFARWMILDPRRSEFGLVRSFFTCAFIHVNWLHCLGNLAYFLVFAPLVEFELGVSTFLLLVAGSTVSGAFLQTIVQPSRLLGFSGAVSGVMIFYCFRFPRAMIGIPVGRGLLVRYAAPTAGLIFVGEFLLQTIQSLSMGTGVSGLGHVGGAAVGYFFHLSQARGPGSRLFELRTLEHGRAAQRVRNWREEGDKLLRQRRG